MAEGLGDQPQPDAETEAEAAQDVCAEFYDAAEQDESPLPRSRRAVKTGPANSSKGRFFGKFMVPMLLAVAAVLLILSVMTLLKLLSASGEGPLATYGWWLILASCPLAAVLVMTAWLLHRAEAGHKRE